MNTIDRKTRACSGCGQALTPDQLTPFQNELLCPSCLNERTVLCAHCGERIFRSDNCGTDTTPLCEDCYEDHYTHCTGCGELIRRENACYRGDDPYCHGCYHSMPAQGISDYCYKPEPIFCGEGSRFFGVELEIDGAGEDDDNADHIMDITNAERTLAYLH